MFLNFVLVLLAFDETGMAVLHFLFALITIIGFSVMTKLQLFIRLKSIQLVNGVVNFLPETALVAGRTLPFFVSLFSSC